MMAMAPRDSRESSTRVGHPFFLREKRPGLFHSQVKTNEVFAFRNCGVAEEMEILRPRTGANNFAGRRPAVQQAGWGVKSGRRQGTLLERPGGGFFFKTQDQRGACFRVRFLREHQENRGSVFDGAPQPEPYV